MSIFGDINSTDHFDKAILETLQVWLPTYLAEHERQSGRAVRSYERPADFVVAEDHAKWTENRVPCVMVVGGDISDMRVMPDGYAGWYDYEVGAYVAAGGDDAEQAAKRMAKAYMAAIRSVLVQRPSLGGIATATVPVSESSGLDEDNRSVAIRIGSFRSLVHGLGLPGGGPVSPDPPDDPDDPHPDWPVVGDTSVTFNAEPIDG